MYQVIISEANLTLMSKKHEPNNFSQVFMLCKERSE